MAIKLEMLRYFVEVAKTGNLSQAAERLGRSPSALSMMLKQFEEHLGAPLFETDRKSKLTLLGEFVLKESIRDLEQLDRTFASIQRFAHTPSGHIRVAAVTSASTSILPPIVARFQTDYPDVSVELSDADSLSVMADLRAQKIDFGIVSDHSDLNARGLDHHVMAQDRYGILFRKDDPLPLNADWSCLLDRPFISNRLCDSSSIPELLIAVDNSKLRARTTTSLAALIERGLGVTVLPELACQNLRDTLEFVIPKGPIYTRKILAYWAPEKVAYVGQRAFLELLQKY
jgi:DNA-binding transcriptional LysR family regulator